MHDTPDPEYCRREAERIRAAAEKEIRRKRRADLLRIAKHYEELAIEIDRCRRGLVN